mmetsp:Transcript_61623/g.150867  ORF Transcript_61623/g.150867 Transcript_61623/m.150867 type:complete len:206 (+) Transcript_61623:98-715(+)
MKVSSIPIYVFSLVVVIQSRAIHVSGSTKVGAGKARVVEPILGQSFKDSTVMAIRGGAVPAKKKMMVGGKNGSQPRSKLLFQLGCPGSLFFGVGALFLPNFFHSNIFSTGPFPENSLYYYMFVVREIMGAWTMWIVASCEMPVETYRQFHLWFTCFLAAQEYMNLTLDPGFPAPFRHFASVLHGSMLLVCGYLYFKEGQQLKSSS